MELPFRFKDRTRVFRKRCTKAGGGLVSGLFGGGCGGRVYFENACPATGGLFHAKQGGQSGGLVDSGRELARQKSFILNVADCEFFRRRQDSAKARKEDSPRLGTPRQTARWRRNISLATIGNRGHHSSMPDLGISEHGGDRGMNLIHRWLCGSARWKEVVGTYILPRSE